MRGSSIMKRLVVVAAILGLFVALPMCHVVFAKNEEKVPICHLNSANDVIDIGGSVIAFGKEIEVSKNAVPAHEAHGDSTDFFPLDVDTRDNLEDILGIRLPNADCFF